MSVVYCRVIMYDVGVKVDTVNSKTGCTITHITSCVKPIE